MRENDEGSAVRIGCRTPLYCVLRSVGFKGAVLPSVPVAQGAPLVAQGAALLAGPGAFFSRSCLLSFRGVRLSGRRGICFCILTEAGGRAFRSDLAPTPPSERQDPRKIAPALRAAQGCTQ